MNKNQVSDDDPIQRLIEWQDHLYDPGYFTGGNIHPLLTGPRPNRYGYLLILSGVMMLISVVALALADQLFWYPLITIISFAVLVFLAGFKLIKKQRPKYSQAKRGKKRRE